MGTDRLSDSKVRAAKPKDKDYTLADGEGLELRVSTSGTRRWVFKYYRPSDRKRTNMAFGSYPGTSLAAARERRRQARALLAEGIDPKAHQLEQAAIARLKHEASTNTFERMAGEWMELKRHKVKPETAMRDWRSLELYVLPRVRA
ncbi:hypothetical protein C3418_09455 [Aeromonas sp. ASNIH8]|uniref:integrase arm-type DNA-binding domain-containing protein n=1 Tax=Aeromonas sp. ASNIH8 TaxID=1920113 RepID=UPI000CDDA1CF|nr:integrase arm-type DNA-binding domain-containing protein [Aeromonas sp. ASNIH8]POV92123.1 hypothetical protein C3418_09455 [Aeromonas sp. ASNIH8]